MSNQNRETAGEVFEFVWKIENFDACYKKAEKSLLSPTFVAEILNGTSWLLRLLINREGHEGFIGVYLRRAQNCRLEGDVSVGFELSILKAGKFDSELLNKEQTFAKPSGFGAHRFVQLSKTLEEKNIFLPNNILTVRCLIWLTQGKDSEANVSEGAALRCICGGIFRNWHSMLTPGAASRSAIERLRKQLNPPVNSCTAMSTIGVERVNFEWSCAKFSDWKADEVHKFPLKSASHISQYLMFTLGLNDGGKVLLTIYKSNKGLGKFLFVGCKVTILGVAGQLNESVQEEFYLETDREQTFLLETPFDANEIAAGSPTRISPNVLFRFRFTFSEGRFVASSIVESSSTLPARDESILSPDSGIVGEETLGLVFADRRFSDVSFRIGEEEIPAHVSIIAVHSPVFDKMFSTEMREKITRVVEVADVDAQTFKRMLKFMYSKTIAEEISAEEAMKLYTACDKYQFIELMGKCSKFLVQNLDVGNACAILSFADDRSDDFLKSSAIEFMCKHASVILSSDAWKELGLEKFPLASEALQKISIGLIR